MGHDGGEQRTLAPFATPAVSAEGVVPHQATGSCPENQVRNQRRKSVLVTGLGRLVVTGGLVLRTHLPVAGIRSHSGLRAGMPVRSRAPERASARIGDHPRRGTGGTPIQLHAGSSGTGDDRIHHLLDGNQPRGCIRPGAQAPGRGTPQGPRTAAGRPREATFQGSFGSWPTCRAPCPPGDTESGDPSPPKVHPGQRLLTVPEPPGVTRCSMALPPRRFSRERAPAPKQVKR